jgi:PBP1b-binding outer membrane lipoprotein LpoB
MTIRTLRVGAAALATIALAACNKATETPKADSTAAANATQSTTPVDSTLKIDSTAPKPTVDSAKPAPAPVKK